jgi:hypothetical protein
MKKGSFVLVALIVGVLCVFVAGGIYAGTKAPDEIRFENEKGLVVFSHKKHTTDYGAGCGECHHDAEGKPLTDLKEGDEVKSCKECHKKPGEVPKEVKKEWRDKKLKKEETGKLELEYVAEAFHTNCQGCHKEYNKKNKTKAAPTTCTKCHEKK